jgi:hypothetical protein
MQKFDKIISFNYFNCSLDILSLLFCHPKIKFYPITKIGILDILTKLYIIYAYILIAKPKRQNEKESDNRPTLDHARSSLGSLLGGSAPRRCAQFNQTLPLLLPFVS